MAPLLETMGLVTPGEAVSLTPLDGGVSSDIFEVVTPRGRFCVKRALARLKVAAVWEAPVARNAAEAAWLRTVGGWFAHATPKLLGEDRAHGLFAMEYLPPDRYPVWKTLLLDGKVDVGFASAVGSALGMIHRRGAGDPELAAAFAHDATFAAIRIEPYLLATGREHPDLTRHFTDVAARTAATRLTLVHGDVSPKNILVGGDGPVFLDAECACYGDPAFDLAFCLNHLLLKGVRLPASRERLRAAFGALVAGYMTHVDWEPRAEFEGRCAALLPALLLARIDGKSPVEYLDETQRQTTRAVARSLIHARPTTLDAIASAWGGRDG